MKQIMNDADYKKATDWLTDTAFKELSDPLFTGLEREKKQAIYDRTTKLVQAYRRGELVQLFPGLRAVYAELGLPVTEAEPKAEEPELPAQAEPIEQEPEQAEETTPASNFSWLDD